ncbi:DUF177 domain-containing protein [Salinicoccus cyprini]|uniref:DUF177 domain-containing protein n=1 Tax=Salinicoccus cyprini TaxID=2493691 RepID=A0A558AXX5_9STAP|nr:DUF177 domain-containing protein [Salinicoccus cyprini]TVT29108.1 DUF177 domain-containing protein [Salinicoccus cyprini]
MRWSLTQLNKFKQKSIAVNEKVQFGEITDRKDVTGTEETSVEGEIHIRNREILVDLMIDTVVNMLDSRTSEDIEVPLHIESQEVFVEEPGETDELAENVHPVTHTLDLEPIVRELIVVNIPYVITKSDETLTGGSNWSVMKEEELAEDAEKVDPRMAKLKSLLDDSENKEE